MYILTSVFPVLESMGFVESCCLCNENSKKMSTCRQNADSNKVGTTATGSRSPEVVMHLGMYLQVSWSCTAHARRSFRWTSSCTPCARRSATATATCACARTTCATARPLVGWHLQPPWFYLPPPHCVTGSYHDRNIILKHFSRWGLLRCACCVDWHPLATAAKMTTIYQSALSNAARTTQQALVWKGLKAALFQWVKRLFRVTMLLSSLLQTGPPLPPRKSIAHLELNAIWSCKVFLCDAARPRR